MKKNLIIRLGSFGDVILSTAFVEALHVKDPKAEIYFLTKVAFEDVFVNNPQITKVFTIKNSNLLDIYKIAKEINQLGITKIFDLSQNFKTYFVSFFIDASTECISKNGFSRRLMVIFKIFPKRVKSIIEKYSQFFGFVDEEIIKPKLYLMMEEKKEVNIFLNYDKKQQYVGINPSAKWKNKKWIFEKYVYVVDELLKRDIKVVLFGEKSDMNYNNKLVEILKQNKKNLINLTGKLNKRELFSVISFLTIFVTTDSAILHIAQSFCVPVIAIFGPTVKEFGFWLTNPKDVLIEEKLMCRPCHLHGGNFCAKGHFKCMKNIDEKVVLGNILIGLKNEK